MGGGASHKTNETDLDIRAKKNNMNTSAGGDYDNEEVLEGHSGCMAILCGTSVYNGDPHGRGLETSQSQFYNTTKSNGLFDIRGGKNKKKKKAAAPEEADDDADAPPTTFKILEPGQETPAADAPAAETPEADAPAEAPAA